MTITTNYYIANIPAYNYNYKKSKQDAMFV